MHIYGSIGRINLIYGLRQRCTPPARWSNSAIIEKLLCLQATAQPPLPPQRPLPAPPHRCQYLRWDSVDSSLVFTDVRCETHSRCCYRTESLVESLLIFQGRERVLSRSKVEKVSSGAASCTQPLNDRARLSPLAVSNSIPVRSSLTRAFL